MKVFKSLVTVVAIILFMASCSQHTTCSAYASTTYKIGNSECDIDVMSSGENPDQI